MKTDFQRLIPFLKEYRALFEALLAFEENKLEVVHRGNLAEIEKSLAAEQALAMRLATEEEKRLQLMVELQLENKSFAQVLELVEDAETYNELAYLYDEMTYYVAQTQTLLDHIARDVEDRLTLIEQKLAQSNLLEAGVYDEKKQKIGFSPKRGTVEKNI